MRLLGHVSDVPRVLRAADVLALPSSAEGLPQVLVQAARAGVPFVAFDVDGVAELLALGAVGRSVPLGDRDGFAVALRDALGARSDGRGGRSGRLGAVGAGRGGRSLPAQLPGRPGTRLSGGPALAVPGQLLGQPVRRSTCGVQPSQVRARSVEPPVRVTSPDCSGW